MMTRKTFASLAILAILLISMIGSVGAQDLPDPETTDTATVVPTEQPGSKFFTHPVVQLLSAYFDEEATPQEPDPSATPSPEPTDADVSDSGLGPIGEEIAAYHEEGMGFGVLVKIYSMVQASQEACAADPGTEPTDEVTDGTTPTDEETCTPLTADELVTAFKEQGMGALFKEYGKPALMGVGHVKQALKDKDTEPTEEPTDEANGKNNPNGNQGNKDNKGNNGNGKPEDKPGKKDK
jgi:hypothetical protein